MIDELRSTRLANKVGGKFKLTALIQKRLQELLQGARPLLKMPREKRNWKLLFRKSCRTK